MSTRRETQRFAVGVDILPVSRMARLVTDNPGILEEVFTRQEAEYCRAKRRGHEHLAARFAAKEAVLKAFGTGLARRMRWTDVEVVHEPGGRPRIALHGEVAVWAARQRLAALEVSLSHTADLAIAQTLVVWTSPSRLAV